MDCFPGGPISMYFTIYIYQQNGPGGGASQTNIQRQIRLCMILLIREVCTFFFQNNKALAVQYRFCVLSWIFGKFFNNFKNI